MAYSIMSDIRIPALMMTARRVPTWLRPPETLKAKALVAIGAMVLATVGATLTGNFTLGRITGQVESLTGTTVPAMIKSLTLTQSSDYLVRLGPVLATTETVEAKTRVLAQLNGESAAFSRDMTDLRGMLPDEPLLGEMEQATNSLVAILNDMAGAVDRRIELSATRNQQSQSIHDITATFNNRIKPWRSMIESDEEYTRSGLSRDAGSAERMKEAVQKYEIAAKQLLALRTALSAFTTIRDFDAELATTRDPARLKFIKINGGLTMQDAEDQVERLPAKLSPEVAEDLTRLRKAFLPLVAARQEEITLLAEADARIEAGRQTASQLSAAASKLVANARADLTQTRTQVLDLAASSQGLLAATFVVSLVVAGLVAWLLFFRSILRPLASITNCMKALADGNAAIQVPHAGSPGEIGAMAQALAVFKNNLAKMESLRKENDEARQEREAERVRDMNKLADTFEGTVSGVAGQVVHATDTLDGLASDLSQAMTRTTATAIGMVETSQEAASKAQTVASAAEELHASAAEIARQVDRSSQQTQSVVREAAAADQMMSELKELSINIGQIVRMIGNIAAQTNMLSLNATVEAAHAGEAGKGFAVVANEVKQLAGSTSAASRDIAEQVKAMQELTDRTATAITEIADSVRDIDVVTGVIARSVEEQGTATQEIAININAINQSLNDMAHALEDVGTDMGENKAVAETLAGSVQVLSSEARRLEREAHDFVSRVRS